jgi:hypothetical protein
MNRLRLADVRTPLARVLNECNSSTRLVDLANEAHRRLVAKGPWVGTQQRYRICISNTGCLVWPRQVETIIAWWRCDMPGTVRNGWYEVSGNGPGLLNSDDMQTGTLIDRGTSATFDEITGTASKVKVVSDVAESGSPRILLRGYDQNAAWIRTQDAGTWIDGEYVDISNNPNYTSNYFTKITEVVKDSTSGPVRLWEYDTLLGTVTRALAYYEPDETLPIYRASIIPGFSNLHGCGSCCGDDNDSTCTNNQLTVIAKLRHIDVRVDNDFFLLGNLAAIKIMAMAILKEERNLFDESIAYELKAVKELQDELNSYEGDGAVPIIRTESPNTWGAGVLNPVTLGYPAIY